MTADGSVGDGSAEAATSCTFDPGFDGGMQMYGPYDPNIRYVGRADLSDPAGPQFHASSAYVTVKFRGNAASVRINDQNNNNGANFFDVILDDQPPFKLSLSDPAVPPIQYWYDISPVDDAGAPVPLACGDHTLTIVKRTEADQGWTQFEGFQFAEILPPDQPATPPHRIEIIGDSITCGAGVEALKKGDVQCTQNGFGHPGGWGQGVENGDKSYGVVAAKLLGAEWHVTCAGGIGLVRNYYGRGSGTMPQVYPYLDPERIPPQQLWDKTQWAVKGDAAVPGLPDAIVIGLGTNDFSRDTATSATTGVYRDPMAVGGPDGGPDGGPGMVQGYISFINQLKTDYSSVSIFLVSSPLLGNMYPTATDTQRDDHWAAIQGVVAYYAPDGGGADHNVHVYAVPQLAQGINTGCGGHPNVRDQADAGGVVATAVKQVMGW
jgi:hypothetical protein